MKRGILHLGIYSLLIVFLMGFCYKTYWNDLPRGVHQWANADRFATSLRFLDEDRKFTDPATLYMNMHDGRVGCEFPLLQWTVAKMVKLGWPRSQMPFLYRFINLLLITSSLYLVLFYFLKKEWITTRIFLFVFLISSPILLFYGYNFLTDIFSLSLVLFAMYFFERDLKKYIFVILIILALATLIKTLAGVFLVAVFGVYFLQEWKRISWRRVSSLLLFLVLVYAVYYYDNHYMIQRNKDLWSVVFMSIARPVSSFSEFIQFAKDTRRFFWDYLTLAQWVVLGVSVAVGVINFKRIQTSYQLLFALLGIGSIAVFALFAVQFKHHDYYVLASLMPVALLCILKGLQFVLEYIPPKTSLILAIVLAVASFTQGSNRNYNRISENFAIDGYYESYDFKWLQNIEDKTADYIEPNALVCVVYVYELNHSLVYLNRKGFIFNAEEMARVKSPFNWWMGKFKVPYLICRKKHIDQLYTDQGGFMQNAKIKAEFEEFIVYEIHGY